MQYVMAAIGVAALSGLLWKALRSPRPAAGRSVRAPDDDPEFLRGLNRRQPGDEG